MHDWYADNLCFPPIQTDVYSTVEMIGMLVKCMQYGDKYQ